MGQEVKSTGNQREKNSPMIERAALPKESYIDKARIRRDKQPEATGNCQRREAMFFK
jgi:hypothetical protein